MNHFAGYTRPLPKGGYWAMLRLPQDARPKPVLGKGGAPVVYDSQLEAQIAVTKHLLQYINGDYRREGEKADASKSDAEKLFGMLINKGRQVEIERRAIG